MVRTQHSLVLKALHNVQARWWSAALGDGPWCRTRPPGRQLAVRTWGMAMDTRRRPSMVPTIHAVIQRTYITNVALRYTLGCALLSWLAHVDVNTHALPQRYIWQGPQFVFKTYQATGEAEVCARRRALRIYWSVQIDTAVRPDFTVDELFRRWWRRRSRTTREGLAAAAAAPWPWPSSRPAPSRFVTARPCPMGMEHVVGLCQ